MYLFLRQYQAALVPMTLQYNLKLSMLIHLSINFKMALSIQVFLLYFYVKKNGPGVMKGKALILDCF